MPANSSENLPVNTPGDIKPPGILQKSVPVKVYKVEKPREHTTWDIQDMRSSIAYFFQHVLNSPPRSE